MRWRPADPESNLDGEGREASVQTIAATLLRTLGADATTDILHNGQPNAAEVTITTSLAATPIARATCISAAPDCSSECLPPQCWPSVLRWQGRMPTVIAAPSRSDYHNVLLHIAISSTDSTLDSTSLLKYGSLAICDYCRRRERMERQF